MKNHGVFVESSYLFLVILNYVWLCEFYLSVASIAIKSRDCSLILAMQHHFYRSFAAYPCLKKPTSKWYGLFSLHYNLGVLSRSNVFKGLGGR